jgi:hypothetical protein
MARPVVAFLKRFTSVSNSFIDDFFSLVDPAARKKDFVIQADAAAKWLGMTKGNLIRALNTHGFESGVDFSVTPGAIENGTP